MHSEAEAKKYSCADCARKFGSYQALNDHRAAKHGSDTTLVDADTKPDWSGQCEVCGQSPIVPITGLCGPCTWGEAETVGGNW